MNDEKIQNKLQQLKQKYKVRLYTPLKYFRGLDSMKNVETRFQRILEGRKSKSNSKNAYRPFKTDTKNAKKKVKTSKYTQAFYKQYPNASSLENKAKATKIPLDIIKKIYKKGLAAWRTGHRVGASQQAWGYARVHSFIMGGCTRFTADKSLYNQAKNKMNTKNFKIIDKYSMCPKYQ